MGATESSPETQGWRILEVIPNGPMWGKNICVYFDFIVGINGYRLNTSSEEFWDIIRSKQDTEIVLTVFNYKTRIKRDIQMTPNNKWGGDGLLGLVIVRDDFTKCDQECIRIISVEPDSPASKAGLQPQYDYILGTPINAFTSFSTFRDTISDYIDQPLPVYVYNSDNASVRLVEITSSSKWSGEGVLGCQVGDGYLHHIPSLRDDQQTIGFEPNSCYVVSSRNSKNTNTQYHSSNPSKHVTTNEKQPPNVQETKTEIVEEKKVIQSKENVDTANVENVDDEEQELPAIRWTDSAHGHSHDSHQHEHQECDGQHSHSHPHQHEEHCEHQHPHENIHAQQQQHQHQHMHSAQCQHTHAPQQNLNLLDQLEQETQHALTQTVQ